MEIPGAATSVTELLNGLLDLEEELREALEAARARAHDRRDLRRIAIATEAATAHGAELERALRSLHGTRTPTDALRRFARARVVLASLLGEGALVRALRENEEDATAAYRRATDRPLPPRLRPVLERILADHRAMAARLGGDVRRASIAAPAELRIA